MLSDDDRLVLTLAEVPRRERYERAVVELGMTPTRYTARLLGLLEDPGAEAERPALVRRLRRLRDARAAVRS